MLRTCHDGDRVDATKAAGRTDRVIWDHSRAGVTVPANPSAPNADLISVGPDGVYEFTALTGLVRRHPSLPWAATLSPRV